KRARHPGLACGQTALAPVPLRGPSRRDVPVPSLLARRPCLASPCATPPLGLLTGNGVRVAWKIVDVALALLFLYEPTGATNRPFQEAEWSHCVGERAAWMPREV